jgi:CRISPR-associated protein (TIGR03984 family)
LFIWREAEGKWRGRIVIEEDGQSYEKIDESHILCGTKAESLANGFTLIHSIPDLQAGEEGEGLRQVMPLAITQNYFKSGKYVQLTMRHYLSEDEDGQANVKCSRLVALLPEQL